MALGNAIYNALFKRTSTFILTIAGGTFFFERTFDIAADTLFDRINEGVSMVT